MRATDFVCFLKHIRPCQGSVWESVSAGWRAPLEDRRTRSSAADRSGAVRGLADLWNMQEANAPHGYVRRLWGKVDDKFGSERRSRGVEVTAPLSIQGLS